MIQPLYNISKSKLNVTIIKTKIKHKETLLNNIKPGC